MLETALQETAQARTAVASAITLVLINDSTLARELWWDLARQLKEPLLTLSLLPETIYQPAPGGASLRKCANGNSSNSPVIIKDVDAAWLGPTPGHALECSGTARPPVARQVAPDDPPLAPDRSGRRPQPTRQLGSGH
jgi:hypothetical protein